MATGAKNLAAHARPGRRPGLEARGAEFGRGIRLPSRPAGPHPDLVEAFRALGDATRLRILELLKVRGGSCCDLVAPDEPGLCACDVEQAVGLSQAAVSHHLGILRRARLVIAEKRGRWMYYRRNEAALAALARATERAV